MSPRARPGIGRRVSNQAPAHGVRLVKADGLEGVAVVEDARIEASLPEMAVAPLFVVEILRVAHVEGVQGLAQGIGGPGDADEMDVVAHQAIGPDGESELGRAFAEHVKVAAVVRVLIEDRLAVIGELEHMMGISGGDGAGDAAH